MKIRSYSICTAEDLTWHDGILSTAAEKKSIEDVEYLTVVMLDNVELSSALDQLTLITFFAIGGTVNAAQTLVKARADQTFCDFNDKNLTSGCEERQRADGRGAERKGNSK